MLENFETFSKSLLNEFRTFLFAFCFLQQKLKENIELGKRKRDFIKRILNWTEINCLKAIKMN